MSKGSTSFHNGLAAEDIAARLYIAKGGEERARRWKTKAGEIDLIIFLDGVIIFVEVKARRTLDIAAAAVSAKQQQRLLTCASEYLAANADLNTDCRFDLAMVDKIGRCEIIENALSG